MSLWCLHCLSEGDGSATEAVTVFDGRALCSGHLADYVKKYNALRRSKRRRLDEVNARLDREKQKLDGLMNAAQPEEARSDG